MKFLFPLMIFFSAFNLSANTLIIKTNNVEAINLIDGSYVKIADLQDGTDSVDGIEVHADKINIKNSIAKKIETFQLSNGHNVHISVVAKSGGDMGGGGL